jgi:L-lactate dehydrogenase complex protein LldE
MHNNGMAPEARALAARMIRVFEKSERVVTVSGSCAAMIREYYPTLFHDDPAMRERAEGFAARVFEFSEFLSTVLKVDLRPLGVRWPGRVTYHYPCHLRGLGMTPNSIERVLGQVGGLEVARLNNAEQCCGFGGTFSTGFPQISGAIVRDKVEDIRATGAGTVVSSEPGCTMNISGACRRAGCAVEFKSLAEIIAEGMGLMERGGGT